ncbi:hypothetical protein B296_00005788 [Ensete ventricosum]|uniref:Uncharacterized protein n=1 Tax=Ensete ventricosum TaxID=4639 RepID=A0A427A785_ENSVE|nr:hypothetical protein B296_00005788 [Ensete ventricosum]
MFCSNQHLSAASTRLVLVDFPSVAKLLNALRSLAVEEAFLCNCFSLLKVKSSSCAAEAFLLGFQHYLVMLGTTVIIIPTALVPQMGGGNSRELPLSQDEKARVIQTLLFVAGLEQSAADHIWNSVACRDRRLIHLRRAHPPSPSFVLAARYSTIVDPHQVSSNRSGCGIRRSRRGLLRHLSISLSRICINQLKRLALSPHPMQSTGTLTTR